MLTRHTPIADSFRGIGQSSAREGNLSARKLGLKTPPITDYDCPAELRNASVKLSADGHIVQKLANKSSVR